MCISPKTDPQSQQLNIKLTVYVSFQEKCLALYTYDLFQIFPLEHGLAGKQLPFLPSSQRD